MRYGDIIPATFIERKNRFVATVRVGNEKMIVHVKNTGRCRELLKEGCTVYLTGVNNPTRKTAYDLVAVDKLCSDNVLRTVNIDSQAPNDACAEWVLSSGLFSERATVRREYTLADSRFDFFVSDGERRVLIEVKGVTLEDKGIAAFPDAPTERGVKHLRELSKLVKEGYECIVLFVIAMKGPHVFRPNDVTHFAFGEALRAAERCGVKILVYDCIVTPGTMQIDKPVEININLDIKV